MPTASTKAPVGIEACGALKNFVANIKGVADSLNLGSWMASASQGWLVLDLKNSEALLGLVSAATAAPILLLSLWAGVLADRVDRRRLLVGT